MTQFFSLRVWAVAILLTIPFCGSAMAQEPMVEANLAKHEPLWVGQKITLVVELLAPGYFSSSASFDIPDPEGVLLMPPVGHPTISSKTIDEVTYSVQRHELTVYPMRAGPLSVPPIIIRFSYKKQALDKTSFQASVTTQGFPFSVTVPPGAENLGQVISARDLKVTETWKPEPGTADVNAGSAFIRTITFTAPDVPGMLFPPFATSSIDGLGIYSKATLHDKSNRGTYQGERQDVITYLCKRPGQYEIPAVQYVWFDINAKKLHTEDFPARSLNVIANPAMARTTTTTSGATSASKLRLILTITFGLSLFFLAGYLIFRSSIGRNKIDQIFTPLRPRHLECLNPSSSIKQSR